MNKDPVLYRPLRGKAKITAAISSAALFLAGCGGSGQSQSAASSRTPSGHSKKFKFDSLGSKLAKGGSSIIRVFPGVKDTAEDKSTAGTYANGQTAEADCITTGRNVSSIPSEGETPRHSDKWLGIISTGSADPTFATVVYTQPSEEAALAQLPPCVDPK